MLAWVIPVPLCRFGYYATCIIGFIPSGDAAEEWWPFGWLRAVTLWKQITCSPRGDWATLPSIAPSVWPLSPPALLRPQTHSLIEMDRSHIWRCAEVFLVFCAVQEIFTFQSSCLFPCAAVYPSGLQKFLLFVWKQLIISYNLNL